MNKNQISKICGTFDLGIVLNDATPISGGLIHRMWRINTSRGSFAIKELDSIIMARPKIHESYIRSEEIESVRIDETYRGRGIGKQMIEWAISKSRESGCHLVQLTTDKKRVALNAEYFVNSFDKAKPRQPNSSQNKYRIVNSGINQIAGRFKKGVFNW